MDSFKGKYERVSAEKYDEFLKVINHNFVAFFLTKCCDFSFKISRINFV